MFQIVATRSLVSFSMCAVAARLAQPPISPLFGHRAQLHLLMGRGLCGAAAMTTSYLAISALPLADAITVRAQGRLTHEHAGQAVQAFGGRGCVLLMVIVLWMCLL